MPPLFGAVAHSGATPTGPPGATYSTGFFEADEGEVVALVAMPTGAGKPAEIETTMIPGGRFAVALHRGPFSDAVRTYGALGSHVAEHDRTLAEPIREIYLAGPAERDDPATYRTEICWPVGPTQHAEVDPGASPYFASVGRTRDRTGPPHVDLMFLKVPQADGGRPKNSVHVDLLSPHRDQRVSRAIGLGATHVGDFDEHATAWTTLADPEGNVFDIGVGH
ncbi:MAG: GyrI-like domain-containing protein [Mycobacteriales bacterium]